MQSMPDGYLIFIMKYQDHLTKLGIIECLLKMRAAEIVFKLLELKHLCLELIIVHGEQQHNQSEVSV